jgi:hypothetical protein
LNQHNFRCGYVGCGTKQGRGERAGSFGAVIRSLVSLATRIIGALTAQGHQQVVSANVGQRAVIQLCLEMAVAKGLRCKKHESR